jgi:hypothetical protein
MEEYKIKHDLSEKEYASVIGWDEGKAPAYVELFRHFRRGFFFCVFLEHPVLQKAQAWLTLNVV